MEDFNSLVKQKIKILDKSPERFQLAIEKAQQQIWMQIEKQFDKLETKGGKVIQSNKNLAVISKIIKQLRAVSSLPTGDYFTAVKTFLSEFEDADKVSLKLAKIIDETLQPSQFSNSIRELYKEVAIQQLFTNPKSNTETTLRNNLINSIASGATFSETVKSARDIVIGGPDTDGRMLANIKTVAATSVAVSTRGYSAIINAEAGVEWYRYVGGEIDTTRLFCDERNGKYFHKKEIEKWGNGENAGDVMGIKKDGTWYGMIEGTNSASIFANCGGWNCRHDLVAVSFFAVPQTVVQRNITNGNYKPD